jgi:hypothetical protein
VIKIGRPRDFWSGLMFAALGTGFAWGARGYGFGTAAEPGPGYFPFGLGVILAILGLGSMLRGLGRAHDPGSSAASPIGRAAWRPLLLLVLSIALFSWLLPHAGLFIALPATVLVASLGGDEFHWGETLANAVVLTVGSWAIFVWGLSLSLPLWPASGWLGR